MNTFIKNTLSVDWNRGTDIGLLLIRVTVSVIMIYGHGYDKIAAIFGGQEIHFMDPIGIGTHLSFYLAAFSEGICALLLILGLFTRFSSFILTINFIVIFVFHAFMVGDGFGVLELRYLYLLIFTILIFTGPGRLSLDAIFFSKSKVA